MQQDHSFPALMAAVMALELELGSLSVDVSAASRVHSAAPGGCSTLRQGLHATRQWARLDEVAVGALGQVCGTCRWSHASVAPTAAATKQGRDVDRLLRGKTVGQKILGGAAVLEDCLEFRTELELCTTGFPELEAFASSIQSRVEELLGGTLKEAWSTHLSTRLPELGRSTKVDPAGGATEPRWHLVEMTRFLPVSVGIEVSALRAARLNEDCLVLLDPAHRLLLDTLSRGMCSELVQDEVMLEQCPDDLLLEHVASVHRRGQGPLLKSLEVAQALL